MIFKPRNQNFITIDKWLAFEISSDELVEKMYKK
jgi:hypothetical protein